MRPTAHHRKVGWFELDGPMNCGAQQEIPATAFSDADFLTCPKEATHTVEVEYEGQPCTVDYCEEHYEQMQKMWAEQGE
jgi:hypothetical protein